MTGPGTIYRVFLETNGRFTICFYSPTRDCYKRSGSFADPNEAAMTVVRMNRNANAR